MPLRNRVTPFGEIVAAPERGAWMGNRGCLHDAGGRLVGRPWRLKAWIICRLQWKERRRPLMTPGRYTELFFLDEPTALAAGHRPCFECRREDAGRFLQAAAPSAKAPELDAALHRDRLTVEGAQRTFEAALGALPDGAMVRRGEGAWLLWRGRLRRWSPGGYTGSEPASAGERVAVLTPRLSVDALARGYAPLPHPSAG